MTSSQPEDVREQKERIRAQAHANRNAQPDKDELSRRIMATFVGLPEYAAARTVMYYVDVRSEVRTRHDLPAALTHAKRIVVPYCLGAGLELFHLQSMEELAAGAYQILEPRPELRDLPGKRVRPEALDLVLVPGVAFDRTGARMGHGLGYYDRLLRHARPDALLVALAFECQLFPDIPTQPHDIFMDRILTEKGAYAGPGPRRRPAATSHAPGGP